MGIDEFTIKLDAPEGHVFKPGELVSGTVTLNTSPNEDLKEGMVVTIYGNAHVEWLDGVGNQKTKYIGHEDYFEESQPYSLTPGQSCHKFSLTIPNKTLPRSITLNKGRIEYGVRAEIKRSWYSLNKTVSVLLPLGPHVSPSTTGSAEQSLDFFSRASSSKTNASKVGFCCFPFCCWYFLSKEKVNMTLTIASLWAYPGEEISYTIDIDNSKTSRPLENVTIQLIMVIIQTGSCGALLGNGRKEDKSETCLVEETLCLTVSPRDQNTTKGIFRIPANLASSPSLLESSVIKVLYKLRASITTVGGCNGMTQMPVDVEVDLVVGTTKDGFTL